MKNENEMSRITKNYVEICVGISLSAKWYQALRKEIRGRDVKWKKSGFHITPFKFFRYLRTQEYGNFLFRNFKKTVHK